MTNRRQKFFDIFITHSWWVILFFLFSFITYEQSVKSKKREIFLHQTKLLSLEKEKQKELKENEDLNLMVNSLSDPNWIELILMRDLGVVPEGKVKVHFTSKEQSR
jgi:hypothetical protein